MGRRIEKNVDGVITKYLYDNEDIIAEYDGNGNLITKYIHGLGIDEPLSMGKNGQTYFYHADGLGSVVALTDSTGTIAQKYDYDSFGNIKSVLNPNFVQPYMFTGREYDPESGLLFLRARELDSKTGTFTQKDPIGFAGGDVNLYRYVGNNPVNYTDPLGLFNPTKAIAALGNSANAGRLYSTGVLKIVGAIGLAETGVGTPGSVVSLVWGLWNVRGATVAQNRGTILWEQALKESWSDASWKNLLGVLPHGEKYDDPCEPSFVDYWWNYKIKNWWELIGEIGTVSP